MVLPRMLWVREFVRYISVRSSLWDLLIRNNLCYHKPVPTGLLIGKEKSRRDGLMVESCIKVGGKSRRADHIFWTKKAAR